MGTPLRGELTRTSKSPPTQPTIDQNLASIQDMLSQFIRLSKPSESPNIIVTPPSQGDVIVDSTAPWSWTAAEAASTEAVLLPYLMHLAAARDDTDIMSFCLTSADNLSAAVIPSAETPQQAMIVGGLVNSLELGSGRSPLHVAAMNGNIESVKLLLKNGALVHLRDSLGHTALYYVSTQSAP